MKLINSNIDRTAYEPYGKNVAINPFHTIRDLQKRVMLLEKQLTDNEPANKLRVSTKGTIYFIDFKNILYLNSDSNYTYIYLTTGKKILVSKTLGKLAKKINHPSFIRIHSSYYINTTYLSKYYKTTGKAIINGNIELPVSKSNKKTISKWMEDD